MLNMIVELYVDGGVIGTNPSMIGGTFSYKLIYTNGSEYGQAGVITAAEMGSPITNNQTEMLALIAGLEQLPVDFQGTIYSDSNVTLGRAFIGWKWTNIPLWMHKRYQKVRARLSTGMRSNISLSMGILQKHN